jgi:hypothetical protein
MNRIIRIAAVAAVLSLAAPAAAQERRPTIGVGIGITPLDSRTDVLLPPIEVYLPIAIAPNFRLEPSLGIFTFDPSGVGRTETSDITLGIGAFFVKSLAPQADMYVGGRLKLNFASRDDGVNDDSDTDLIVAAALGGEYYLAPQLSLGLEAQLGIYQRGDVSGDDSGFFTHGLAFLRLFF